MIKKLIDVVLARHSWTKQSTPRNNRLPESITYGPPGWYRVHAAPMVIDTDRFRRLTPLDWSHEKARL